MERLAANSPAAPCCGNAPLGCRGEAARPCPGPSARSTLKTAWLTNQKPHKPGTGADDQATGASARRRRNVWYGSARNSGSKGLNEAVTRERGAEGFTVGHPEAIASMPSANHVLRPPAQ